MNSEEITESLLSPYRVLDLTDEKGFLCGKILGDLGADVIKIERPGGDPSRNIGPFYGDVPDPERSLYWWAYNTSKRGITLNIEIPEGREIFKKLVKTTDFVIESFPPGIMDKLGLGYSTMSNINPRVILTSITPFGQEGPCKEYRASDIVAMATGGLMFISGDSDRSPVRCSVEQSYPLAGAQAAEGTLIAHYHRQLTGEGQHVDVSLQESVLIAAFFVPHQWSTFKSIVERKGIYLDRGSPEKKRDMRNIFPCKEGYICWHVVTGPLGRYTRHLAEWLASEGMASDSLKETEWETIDMNEIEQGQLAMWEDEFAKFFLTKTKGELHRESVRRSMMIFPCNSVEDLLGNEQLKDRDYWVNVEHPELGRSFLYPGAPFKLSNAQWKIARRSPLIGEDNNEVYRELLGLSGQELDNLKNKGII